MPSPLGYQRVQKTRMARGRACPEWVLRVACIEKNERGQEVITRYVDKKAEPVSDSVRALLSMRKMELMSHAACLGIPTRRVNNKGRANLWRAMEDVRKDVLRAETEQSMATCEGRGPEAFLH